MLAALLAWFKSPANVTAFALVALSAAVILFVAFNAPEHTPERSDTSQCEGR